MKTLKRIWLGFLCLVCLLSFLAMTPVLIQFPKALWSGQISETFRSYWKNLKTNTSSDLRRLRESRN